MIREIQILSAREKLVNDCVWREMELHNSVAARRAEGHMQLSARAAFLEQSHEVQFRGVVEQRVVQAHQQQLRDRYDMYNRWAEDAWIRKKERCLWYYRRTTGIINRESIRKAVNRELERLLPAKFDPKSIFKRLQKSLTQRYDWGIVKIHAPPVLLFPKTLHPNDSVA